MPQVDPDSNQDYYFICLLTYKVQGTPQKYLKLLLEYEIYFLIILPTQINLELTGRPKYDLKHCTPCVLSCNENRLTFVCRGRHMVPAFTKYKRHLCLRLLEIHNTSILLKFRSLHS